MMLFLTYLLKVALCSALLTGYYFLALRNRAFHQWNRFYLLSAVLLSITIPLFRFTIFHSGEEDSTALQLLQAMSMGDEYVVHATRNSQPLISLETGLGMLYLAVSVVLLGGLVFSLARILRLVRRHTARPLNNIQIINAPEKGTPFSFFRYIFWNPSIDLQSETGRQIFRHELVHVREGHSLDKLLVQLVLVAFWCNPFFWIIRHELRMIHEFIADKKAVAQQDASALAAMILQAAYPGHYSQLTNSFFQQSIKRRLHMLTKNQSPRFSYISRLLFIPLAACLVLAFTVRTQTPETGPTEVILLQQPGAAAQNDTSPTPLFGTIDKKGASPLPDSLGFDAAHRLPVTLSLPTLGAYDIEELKQRFNITGSRTYNSDALVQQRIGPRDTEWLKKGSNQLELGSFSYEHEWLKKRTVLDYTGADTTPSPKTPDFKGLVYVDGELYKGDLKQIPPHTIESMNVWKGEEAVKRYGEKGREGVIEITRKKGAGEGHGKPDAPAKVQLSSFKGLVYVDGELYKGDLKQIQPHTIQSVNVLKGESALKKYGDKGKEGVIEITLKKEPVTTTEKGKEAESEAPAFTRVEEEAQFPGGVTAWRKFLEQNLNAAVPIDKGAPAGTYTTIMQLLIDSDGSILEIKPVTQQGYGTEEEVVRVMKLSPKWIPAKQNGRAVKAYRKQPITFVISEDTAEPVTTKRQ